MFFRIHLLTLEPQEIPGRNDYALLIMLTAKCTAHDTYCNIHDIYCSEACLSDLYHCLRLLSAVLCVRLYIVYHIVPFIYLQAFFITVVSYSACTLLFCVKCSSMPQRICVTFPCQCMTVMTRKDSKVDLICFFCSIPGFRQMAVFRLIK